MKFIDFLFIYIAVISFISVIITIHDKRAAKTKGQRVPEKRFFLLALLGGSAAMYITMLQIRHKTLHKRFMIGIPIIIIIQLLIICILFYFKAICY